VQSSSELTHVAMLYLRVSPYCAFILVQSYCTFVSNLKTHKAAALRHIMESRATASLRKVLQGPQRQSGPNKAEGKASRSKQASEPEEDKMPRDDEWTPRELPLSGNAMAHIREIDASKLMPTDLIGMEDVYTTLTIVIIDWLRLKGGAADVPMLEDAALTQAAEIVVLAERVAERNVEIPEEMQRCWEEAQGMRTAVIRYHEARLENWDKARRERLEGMRRFLSV